MLIISPAAFTAMDARSFQVSGDQLAYWLRLLGLTVPVGSAWDVWWQDVCSQGDELGATRKQTLFFHALLVALHGPEYLQLPEFGWLLELLTENRTHEPVYHLAEDVWPEVIEVARDIYITDQAARQ